MKKTICTILALACFLAAQSNQTFAEAKQAQKAMDFAQYTSPEAYGAVGDGVTDDTLAWQRAVDSGKPVIAGSKKYKCSTIMVSMDADIDCRNAVFECTDAVLFSCFGSIKGGTTEKDYTANSDYTLSDNFTGIVYLVGKNNIFRQRDYYVGGSIEEFCEGVLSTQIPVDIVDVKAYRMNPIQVNIRNISDVFFTSNEKYKIVIDLQYCAFSTIKNVNMTHGCFSVVQFSQCFKCTYRDSHLEIPQYGQPANYYYPIGIIDTCYTNIENVFAHCVGWHCITTSGRTLCRGTKVTNCELYCDYAIPAYGDHSNGIETTILNSTISSVGLGAMGKLLNSNIVCCKDDDMCRVNMDMSSVDGLAHYVIENCNFYPQSKKFAGVRVVCAPRDSGCDANYYLDSLSVVNCRNMSKTVEMPIEQVVTLMVTGETIIKVLNMVNSNLSVEMEAEKTSIIGS